MKSIFLCIMRKAPSLWAIMSAEIFLTSLVYAILSTGGINKSVSLLISLCVAVVLIMSSFFIFPQVFFGFRYLLFKHDLVRKVLNDQGENFWKRGEEMLKALENEKRKLEMERDRISFAKEQLELTAKRTEIALELSQKLVDHLSSDISTEKRKAQALLPGRFQFTETDDVKKLERVLQALEELKGKP